MSVYGRGPSWRFQSARLLPRERSLEARERFSSGAIVEPGGSFENIFRCAGPSTRKNDSLSTRSTVASETARAEVERTASVSNAREPKWSPALARREMCTWVAPAEPPGEGGMEAMLEQPSRR